MTDRSSALEPAHVAADDRGFLLGDGLFETVRLYRGRPFRLEDHLRRMQGAAETVGLDLPADLDTRVRTFLGDASDGGDAALRITVSRGRGGDLAGSEGVALPTLALRLMPAPRPTTEDVRPLAAVLEGWLHEKAVTSAVKHVGYLERVTALRRARRRGADEALLRNSEGRVVEGTSSNVAAVTAAGVLVTPGPGQGALAGITRAVLLEVAAGAAPEMAVEERGLEPREIPGLRELFLTSSIREMVPVVRVEDSPVGDGVAGPLFRRLRAGFREVVRRETGG